ncbi:MAG: hypothetical protein U9Q15_05480 [Patescibacteria group bacterium]|nr:hypothetical protein [Patescibacteria group bacterium]
MPLYFLGALGAGGLAISFFMYLMFMTNHAEVPIPTFDTLLPYLTEMGIPVALGVGAAMLGVIVMSVIHLSFLKWNIIEFLKFKKTEDYTALRNSNAEVTLMAIPLTLAMTMNVFFVLVVLFVPGFYSIIEYIFPAAIVGFFIIGAYAINIFGEYITRLLDKGDFNFDANNSLAQMLSIFAFTMVGVGLAGPAAMSHTEATAVIALLGSIFFISISVLLLVIKMILGFKSMFRHGLDRAAAPSMWIIIPILTLIGISLVRQTHGFAHNLDIAIEPGSYFILTAIIISIQIFFGYLGYKIMTVNNYFQDFIHGEEKSPGSYALICPGVAFFVFSFFFLHLGLVKTGIVDMFSIVYFVILLPLMYIQYKTIATMLKLNKKLV